MKNKITRNWGLKLVSFLFAVMLWIIVTNINDPVTPLRASYVPVTILNKELITERGQICEVLDGTDVIGQVVVYAPRSIIDSLKETDIVAIADVNDLTSLDTVPIKLSTNKYNDKLESIRGSIDSVKLNIEDKQTRSFPIKANVVGEVAEGYMQGDVSTDQNLIRVSGPQSVVSRIAKAQAEVDVSGLTGSIGTIGADTDIRLYDAEGKEIRSASLEKSISKVRVSVDILEMKTVPISYLASGVPADGYRMTGETKSSRNNIVIAGKSKTVQNVSAIEIPEGEIDVTGAQEDVTTLVDLRKYLPEGIIFAEEDFTGMVNITVFIEQEVRRTLSVKAEDIRITGVPAGYEARVVDPEENYSIALVGLASEFDEINLNTLQVSVDVAAWIADEELAEPEIGFHQMPLSVNLPEGSAIVWGEQEVQVHLTERETE